MGKTRSLKKISTNKRGVSSVFIAIYGALLAILLISTLFLGLTTTDVSITNYFHTEQNRSQEKIMITAFNETEVGQIYQFIRINNTGSITSRVKAIYINGKFICDPSKFSGDSYIPPQSYKWIRLFPNVIPPITEQTALNYSWTVTTERGTVSNSLPGNLAPSGPGVNASVGFYWGPIYFFWDSFNWENGIGPNLNNQNGPWRNGWLVKSGNAATTWRIKVQNIDSQNRSIILNSTTSFTIVGPTKNNQILPWFIDGILNWNTGEWTGRSGPITLKPGGEYYVYFTWTTSSSATTQSPNFGNNPNPIITTNFLTFAGNFKESNDSLTPFGETVPLEAILVTNTAMAANLVLTANPTSIPANGASTSTITATVLDGNGNPVQNEQVVFFTSAGTLSSDIATTNVAGIAQVTLTSSSIVTKAALAAICQEVVIGFANVDFTVP